MLFDIIALLLGIQLYWIVGVLVSFADTKARQWMDNHPRWDMVAPDVYPRRVALLWVIYVPVALMVCLWWVFTNGSTLAHKFLVDRSK